MTMALLVDVKDAKITSVNPRRELHGEDSVLGVDLDVTLETDATVMNQFDLSGNVKWQEFLWDDDGQVHALGLGAIPFTTTFEDQTVTLGWGGKKSRTYKGAMVKKCKATAMFGRRVRLSLQVQIHPAKREMEYLSDAILHDSAHFKLDPPDQQDAFEDDRQEAAAS